MGWMLDDVNQFNKKRPTFAPCVCQPVWQKTAIRSASVGRACWKASSRPTNSTLNHWLRALTGVFWWGGRPSIRTQQLSGRNRCRNIGSLVQRLHPELTVYFFQPAGLNGKKTQCVPGFRLTTQCLSSR